MAELQKISLAKANGKEIFLYSKLANRHGLITGASGTGKTVTLKTMAEAFSKIGVPVFLQDIKGDVSGVCEKFPTKFWDVYGEKGHPVRVTISDLGPSLLSRLLNLSDVQESVLSMVFKIADDQGLLLIDLKDLRAMLNFASEHKEEYERDYGAISTVSVNTILRNLIKLEEDGGNEFFGEPALDIADWMRTDIDGRGVINLLHSVKLSQNPLLYGTFLLWMLSEIYERLPEVGDLDKPRMVFFFDEAHMLFKDTPTALRDKITQVVKLVRSKGIGVYFITQSPADIPDEVLAQLSNRVQHALRAYTPQEQKAIKVAASAFRPNPEFKTEDVITNLGIGEALVSFLGEDGAPMIVERAMINMCESPTSPAPDDVVQKSILSSEFELKYRNAIDRESAYEVIRESEEEAEALAQAEAEAQAEAQAQAETQARAQALANASYAQAQGIYDENQLPPMRKKAAASTKAQPKTKAQKEIERNVNRLAGNMGAAAVRSVGNSLINAALGDSKKTIVGKAAKSVVSTPSTTIGREAGKTLIRGILGSLK